SSWKAKLYLPPHPLPLCPTTPKYRYGFPKSIALPRLRWLGIPFVRLLSLFFPVYIYPIIFLIATKHLYIALVPAPSYPILVQGRFYSTIWLIHMQAIIKFTFGFQSKEFGEIITYFLLFHIHDPKALDPRGVDNPGPEP